MSYMFEGCSSLNYLDISNLDIRNSTNLISFFPNKLNKIKLGVNNNLKVNTTYGYPFGRGTWQKEDGKEYSIIEICNNSLTGNAAGTYTKVSDISKQMVPTYFVDYRIDSLDEIGSFTTTNPEVFELVNDKNVIVKNIPVSNNDDYTVTGSCELKFIDKVTAKNDDTKKIVTLLHQKNLKITF